MKKVLITKKWIIGVAGFCLLTGFGYDQNSLSWLEFHVYDKHSGQIVPDASVCLGTSVKQNQFGAMRTNQNGIVRFRQLPESPLVLTISRSGYQGQKRVMEPPLQSRAVIVKIAKGGGGPECNAAEVTASAPRPAGLSIKTLKVKHAGGNALAGDVLIQLTVSGKANQVRISEKPDFQGADWQSLQPELPFSLSSGAGSKLIYIQLRRHAEADGASMDVVSAVVKTHYRVH